MFSREGIPRTRCAPGREAAARPRTASRPHITTAPGQGQVPKGCGKGRACGCAGRTRRNTDYMSPVFLLLFPALSPPRSLYFSSCHPKFFFFFPSLPFYFYLFIYLYFFVSAAGHLVSHMDGVILEESPRESLLKPPFVLGVEKSIVVVEKDLDKIRTVSIQDCLISP